MRKYRKKAAITSRGLYLRKRIAGNRSRAKFTGLIYLLATIALAAIVCIFPLLTHELANLKVMTFWKIFNADTFKNFSLSNTTLVYEVAISVLYALMLLGLVINVLRSLGKLGWLFKKRANKTYGFNRNVYAMEDMGRIFSGSYAVVLFTYFLIAVLCKDFNGKTYEIDKLWMLSTLGGGLFIHFFCGILGAKTRYYDLEDGQILEEKRIVGRFAPLFRNFLQAATVFSVMYFFLQFTTLNTIIPELFTLQGIKDLVADIPQLITACVQVVLLLCLAVLAKHATATTEYNFDGVNGAGMKNFRVFSFFAFLAAGGTLAYRYLFVEKTLDTNLLIIAGIAFVMFVIELIMRKMPKFPSAKKGKIMEEEFSIDEITFPKEEKVDQSF